ncbi:MAG: hypothetical protein KFH98_16530 [Gemmatimonadetes bacterium]|nr:hypothetical protein [Gemmatimonadota bacterium]
MTRQRRFTAPATAFLLLISACGADGTGPDDEPEFVMDRIVFNIGHIEVIHDCDPAWDNPGDFQGYVGIWLATDTTQGAYQLVSSSRYTMMFLNSGESASGGHIRAEGLVPRDPARPVRLQGVFSELDHDEVDAEAKLGEQLQWDESRNCWQIEGACLPTVADEYHQTWTHHVHTRDDVWNPFNSNDEGCRFYVTFVLRISGS